MCVYLELTLELQHQTAKKAEFSPTAFTSVQGEGHDWEELVMSMLATSVHSPSPHVSNR